MIIVLIKKKTFSGEKLKKGILFILIIIFTSGCELIVLGTKKERAIEINQNSSIGVVHLFKVELDSNNIRGATEVLARPTGEHYLAIDKYEMFWEMERMARIIAQKPITDFKTDTLSDNNHKITVHFDYITEVDFVIEKIDNNWYITQYNEQMRWY
jgi:hypothetical protein